MNNFKEGDEVEIIKGCSGNNVGEKYTVKYRDGALHAGQCTCQDKGYWKLISKTKTMTIFKIGDKVKYVSTHFSDGPTNPKWGGSEGKIEGEIIDGKTENWDIEWENGEQNSAYRDSDLELINPPKKKKGISNLKAAAKALRKTGPKNWFEAEATIKIKIEVAGTEADAQDEILEEYDNNGMENLTHKQLIITGIQKL